jgi:hypothetical protein
MRPLRGQGQADRHRVRGPLPREHATLGDGAIPLGPIAARIATRITR